MKRYSIGENAAGGQRRLSPSQLIADTCSLGVTMRAGLGGHAGRRQADEQQAVDCGGRRREVGPHHADADEDVEGAVDDDGREDGGDRVRANDRDN